MGFIMSTEKPSKPWIYDYIKNTGKYEPSANPQYYTWKMRSLWEDQDSCIVWKNDTGQPMTIKKFSVKSCSCNSGGKSYWSSTGQVSTSAGGYGGTYYSYISVTSETDTSNLISAKFNNSSRVTAPVSNCGYNMNYAGSSTSDTAAFGNYPYEGNQGLNYREFDITDCPTIPAGGHAILHFGIQSWNSGSTTTNSVVRFILDTSVVKVDIEPEDKGYFWRYSKSDNKWHIVKPYYVYDNGKWISVEEIKK